MATGMARLAGTSAVAKRVRRAEQKRRAGDDGTGVVGDIVEADVWGER